MLSSTTSPLFYHHFPIFAFDHSIILHPFWTHFAPILHCFALFCNVLHRFARFARFARPHW